jgi:hypothetical protein
LSAHDKKSAAFVEGVLAEHVRFQGMQGVVKERAKRASTENSRFGGSDV